MRIIRFVPNAWEDYLYWQDQDKKTLKRINLLITATARDLFIGILESLNRYEVTYPVIGPGALMTPTGWCTGQPMPSW